MRKRQRQVTFFFAAATILAGLLALDLVSSEPTPPSIAAHPTTALPDPIDSPPARGELIALIVLDDVRADRMGVCGHARPTTPFLSSTCSEAEATCRCRAYAPGSWTIPSHASFFTGLPVERHGVGSPASHAEAGRTETFYRTLPVSVPTLAESMGERGYRTVAISGNPVLDESSGLLRGFEETEVATSFTDLRGDPLVRRVRRALETPDPSGRPLFLFVNIADAHEPWGPVPDGLEWLDRPRYMRFEEPYESYRTRFLRGELDARESQALLSHFSDSYDYGVFQADQTLEGVMRALHETGWTTSGSHRVVITSDHGELLGEHDALGHGAPLLYEGLSRVPLMVLSSRPSEPPLPDPVSTLAVFDLLRGAKPDHAVQAAAFAAPGWRKRYGERWGHSHGAAIWTENERYMLLDGASLSFDLAHESTRPEGRPLAEGPEKRQLEALARQLQDAAAAPVPEGSEDVTRMLRALGYVE